jgi:hypothetical protein
MLTVSYFCIATEIRFINNSISISIDKYNNSSLSFTTSASNTIQSKDESEFWHSKSVEVGCLYLPGSCPIIKHYVTSYYKHYSSSHLQAIVIYLFIL